MSVIVGSTGLVGSALAAALPGARALGHADLDITDAGAVRRVMRDLRPDVIFNTAVIGVDECQQRPDLAHAINVDGPTRLAEAAQEHGATLVHFSSNYVFDGHGHGQPYTVHDVPRPINVYGQTKLEGEIAAARHCPRTFIIRTSWVFGARKRSFLATVGDKLRRGQKVRAISDTWASSTYVSDLVERVLALVEGEEFGVHHAVNEGLCSYETFAREAARLLAIPTEVADHLIETVSEEEMKRAAPRPPFTPMQCLPPMRRWQDALADYLRQ